MTRRARRAIAVSMLGGLLLAGCGGPPAETATEPAAVSTEPGATSPTQFPAELRETFLARCSSDANSEPCECVLEFIEQNVPLDEFVEIGVELESGGEVPPILQRAVNECT